MLLLLLGSCHLKTVCLLLCKIHLLLGLLLENLLLLEMVHDYLGVLDLFNEVSEFLLCFLYFSYAELRDLKHVLGVESEFGIHISDTTSSEPGSEGRRHKLVERFTPKHFRCSHHFFE